MKECNWKIVFCGDLGILSIALRRIMKEKEGEREGRKERRKERERKRNQVTVTGKYGSFNFVPSLCVSWSRTT